AEPRSRPCRTPAHPLAPRPGTDPHADRPAAPPSASMEDTSMDLAADTLNNRPSPPWLWRLIATGLSFMLFGLGGLVLRLIVFPLLALLPGDATRHRLRARQTISRLFWLFVQFMYRSGVLTYQVEGVERLGRPGQLVIANHPS